LFLFCRARNVEVVEIAAAFFLSTRLSYRDCIVFVYYIKKYSIKTNGMQTKTILDFLFGRTLRKTLLLGLVLTVLFELCGRVDDASDVFQSIQNKDVISWNNMIYPLGMSCCGEKTLELLGHMQQTDVVPMITLSCPCMQSGLFGK
jgi:hypothetical protein